MTTQISGSTAALAELAGAAGPAHVITDANSLLAAETSTFRTDRRIPVIVRPANRAGVQQCLRIANRFGVPVHPISSGKNWGYGSRVPAADNCILLDLERLNRIVDYDEKLAYVTVEPGVTQAFQAAQWS